MCHTDRWQAGHTNSRSFPPLWRGRRSIRIGISAWPVSATNTRSLSARRATAWGALVLSLFLGLRLAADAGNRPPLQWSFRAHQSRSERTNQPGPTAYPHLNLRVGLFRPCFGARGRTALVHTAGPSRRGFGAFPADLAPTGGPGGSIEPEPRALCLPWAGPTCAAGRPAPLNN
jgi:hypothetical protein